VLKTIVLPRQARDKQGKALKKHYRCSYSGSWSWDRKEDKMTDFFTATELLWTLISTTAWNGTLVMNIGPNAVRENASLLSEFICTFKHDRFTKTGSGQT
jgi:hypothetical protein